MTKKQGQNLFDVLQLLATQYPEALTANKRKQDYENQQYNSRLKQEGERSVYGGRNVEIGNFAVPDSRESRLAIEADALAREGKKREGEQDMLDLNALLSKTKYRNMEGKNAGGNYKYIPEFEGMTDNDIADKKIADALKIKEKFNALESDSGLESDEGNYLMKADKQELFRKLHPELEQTDNDVKFYSALKKAPSTPVKYKKIEDAIEPSEALLEGDLQKYVRSTGERLKTDEALKAMDKGAVNREQLQTLRPMIGDKKYEGLERNIDTSERKSTQPSSNPNFKRIADDLDDIVRIGQSLNVEVDDEATGTSELDRFVARFLRNINDPKNDLANYEKQMLKRKILDVLNAEKVYFTKQRGYPVRLKTENLNKTAKVLGL